MGELKSRKVNQCSNLHLEVLKELSLSLPTIRRALSFLDLKRATPVVATVETINSRVCLSSCQQAVKVELMILTMNQKFQMVIVTVTRIQTSSKSKWYVLYEVHLFQNVCAIISVLHLFKN